MKILQGTIFTAIMSLAIGSAALAQDQVEETKNDTIWSRWVYQPSTIYSTRVYDLSKYDSTVFMPFERRCFIEKICCNMVHNDYNGPVALIGYDYHPVFGYENLYKDNRNTHNLNLALGYYFSVPEAIVTFNFSTTPNFQHQKLGASLLVNAFGMRFHDDKFSAEIGRVGTQFGVTLDNGVAVPYFEESLAIVSPNGRSQIQISYLKQLTSIEAGWHHEGFYIGYTYILAHSRFAKK